MTTTATTSEWVYDPYDHETIFNPHGVFKRLRNESPLYYSEEHDFFAISRYQDIERTLLNRDTFISSRGVTLDMLKSGMEIPPGTLIFEDEPTHGIHRALLSRMFTPRRLSSLEPDIRQLCVNLLDPFVGAGGFDFVEDLGSQVPMRVIGMLLGIPEADQQSVRDHFGRQRADEPQGDAILSGAIFADYIDWRVDHPSDDIMTQLLNAEFEDEHGETKRLTRDELLAYVNIVAAAGNETTRVLIGWTGELLAENPAERRLLVEDPSLVPNAIEELLRYEPNTLQNCRYVTQDVEFYDRVVPAGSMAEYRSWSFAASAAERDAHVRDAQPLVGLRLARVRYFDLDWIDYPTSARTIVEPQEWQQPPWRHPTCDTIDWGLELESTTGRVFSISWDGPVGDSMGISEQPMLDGCGDAIWDVTERSRWRNHIGHVISGITLHYFPWSPTGVWEDHRWPDGWWCPRITIDFGGPVVEVLLAKTLSDDHILFPVHDNIAVVFESDELPG